MKLAYIFVLLFFTISNMIAQNDSLELFTKNETKKIIGISLHSGYYHLKADVPGSGLGLGGRIHFAVNSTFSMRLNFLISSAEGISNQPYTHSTVTNLSNVGGPLVEPVYAPYYNNPQGWFPSYRFTQAILELEGLMSVNRLLNKQLDLDIKIIDLYILGSYGLFGHATELDLLDANGSPYSNLTTNSGWTTSKYETYAGRKEIKENLIKIYDGKYETQEIFQARNRTYSYGGGLRYNIAPSIAFGVEYKVIKYPDFDYADGIKFINSFQFSKENDTGKYSNVFFEIKF